MIYIIISIVILFFYTVIGKLVLELSKTFNTCASLWSLRVYLARAWSDAQTPRLRNTRWDNSLMDEYLKRKNNKSPMDIDTDEYISLLKTQDHTWMLNIIFSRLGITSSSFKYIGRLQQDTVHTRYTNTSDTIQPITLHTHVILNKIIYYIRRVSCILQYYKYLIIIYLIYTSFIYTTIYCFIDLSYFIYIILFLCF